MNESIVLTIIRYGGREFTQQMRDIAVRELSENAHLDSEESTELMVVRDACNAWLKDEG